MAMVMVFLVLEWQKSGERNIVDANFIVYYSDEDTSIKFQSQKVSFSELPNMLKEEGL